MNVADLELFLDVARQGGFAKAARVRNTDPSAISRAIAALEHRVGARLFHRTTRRVTLTEAGRRFRDRIAGVVADLDSAVDEVRGAVRGPTGTLRMTASNACGPACIAPLLPEFSALYPAMKIELVLSDDNLDLVAERIDLAIRLAPANNISLAGVRLFDTNYRVCASPAYAQRLGRPAAPEELSERRCLLFPFEGFRRLWKFQSRNGGPARHVPVDGDLITSSALSLKTCAVAGMGPALLPGWLVEAELQRGELLDLFPDYRVTGTEDDTAAWLLYPSRTHVPMKTKLMADFLRARLQRHAPEVRLPRRQAGASL